MLDLFYLFTGFPFSLSGFMVVLVVSVVTIITTIILITIRRDYHSGMDMLEGERFSGFAVPLICLNTFIVGNKTANYWLYSLPKTNCYFIVHCMTASVKSSAVLSLVRS